MKPVIINTKLKTYVLTLEGGKELTLDLYPKEYKKLKYSLTKGGQVQIHCQKPIYVNNSQPIITGFTKDNQKVEVASRYVMYVTSKPQLYLLKFFDKGKNLLKTFNDVYELSVQNNIYTIKMQKKQNVILQMSEGTTYKLKRE